MTWLVRQIGLKRVGVRSFAKYRVRSQRGVYIVTTYPDTDYITVYKVTEPMPDFVKSRHISGAPKLRAELLAAIREFEREAQ